MLDQLKKSIFWKLLFLGVILFVLFCSLEEKKTFPKGTFQFQNDFYSQSPFIDPTRKPQPEIPDFLVVEGLYLQSVLPPTFILPQVFAQIVTGQEPNNEIKKHIVEEGESIWSIAQKYDLKLETIIWANDLRDQIIRPGQELIILPVDGLIHIVEKGDTLEEIAKKYQADLEKILVFNELALADEIFENQALIIPDGKLPSPPKIKTPSLVNFSTNNFYGQSHNYPYGYCTWWVAQKRAIPSWGHAKNWLDNAQASGFPVCRGSYCPPQVGAVISLKGIPGYGHVAYVERVEGNKVIFSEMNYIGWGKMNYRSLKIGDPQIKGYIY